MTFVLLVRAPATRRSLNNRWSIWHPRNIFNPNSDRSASHLYELQAERHDCKSPGLPYIQAPPLVATFRKHILPQQSVENSNTSSLSDPTMSQVCENEPPHFFRLPAELRNVIYEDVLGDLGNKFTCFGGLSYVLKDSKSLNLWFVNRQMYQETRLLPYSMNSITAGPRTDYVKWLKQRTQEQLRAISMVHFVFDTFGIPTAEAAIANATDDGNFSSHSLIVMNRLLSQKLEFSKLPGLKHIRVELRSQSNSFFELEEQIELLQEAKCQIECLNPGADVDVEMECQGEWLSRDAIPASSTTGVRIMRFDKIWEGCGYSVQDIWRRKGLDYAGNTIDAEVRKDSLRGMWNRQATR